MIAINNNSKLILLNTLLKQYYEVVDNNEASYPKDKIEFENITNHLENVWKSACI
jgi:hypothetical protein